MRKEGSSQQWVGKSFLVLLVALVFVWGLPGFAGAWSYKEAAQPYAGQSITVLDEVTPLQESLKKLVPLFVEETGIKVDYQLLNHFEVLAKSQADSLSGAGAYDAVMLHSPQLGLLHDAGVLRPIDDFMNNPSLRNPELDTGDILPVWEDVSSFRGKTYAFLNWNYNMVYWTRADLMNHPEEKADFKKRYGYYLGPAETFQEMRDIAEFFTRKKGEKLAGKTLESDFYGVTLEGLKHGTTFTDVWGNWIRNWGGELFDGEGRPTIDRPENVAALKFWASLWKFSPPGQAEFSLIDIPTIMANGIAAQTLAWGTYAMGVDNPQTSKLSGKFLYRTMPRNVAYSGRRSVETEPSSIFMNKRSRNPEATYLFMQWVVEKSTQEKLFNVVKGEGVPMRMSSWDSPTLTGSRHAGLYQAMRAGVNYSRAKPKAPKLYEIMDVMGGVFQEIGNGTRSAEEGLSEGQRKVLQICEICALK
jgi:multiple sugar transport system substrate-binding protein